MFAALIWLITLVGLGVLAYFRAPLLRWGLFLISVGALGRISTEGGFGIRTDLPGWVLALLPGLIISALAVPVIRRIAIVRPAFRFVKKLLPRVSPTEQEALDAGTVGWDAELFSGRPDWITLFKIRKPTLTADEKAFLDGPVEALCAMLDDWDIRHNRADLPPEVWSFLKANGFFGMLISREQGGLGFSAQAQSQVVSKIASRSITAAITVMVPNSLGPGELLEKYGTPEQKAKYLGRLAAGVEIPCFALTGPHAGSDAASMRDIGVVCYDLYEGKKTLGVKLSWDKRYITLAPVATLIGLAFNLRDPERLIGDREHVGITLALVPADFKGVQIGRRHFPARSAFMNGPTQGRNVFVPMEFLIGGVERAGQGWSMLMECLATGRAISLPAIGSVSIKQALRVTSAYARVRRQFGMPIGLMEGVAEPLSRLVRLAYTHEAARGLTAGMVDAGQRPAVISALLKYRTTDAMRQALNDAMDIHGGRAVQDGPNNYLFSAYAATPVAVTVEGANILTRSLITFAQGAVRAHPYLRAEIAAAAMEDEKTGLRAFEPAFCGHVSFMLANMAGSLFHALTFGRYAPSPAQHDLAQLYRDLSRYAQSFALVADWSVIFLGNALKRKQRLAGRLADVLSELYLFSAVLKRYEDEGRNPEDKALVTAIAADARFEIEERLAAVFANFPHPVLRWAMRALVFPLGRHAKPASDRETYALARAVMVPGAFRDRLTTGVYVSLDPKDVTGSLEDALIKVSKVAEIETRFVKAIKAGTIERRLDRDAITEAVDKGILSEAEAGALRLADQATDRVIRVDDFPADALARPMVAAAPLDKAAE